MIAEVLRQLVLTHYIIQLSEFFFNTLSLVALYFNVSVFDSAPSSTGLFQDAGNIVQGSWIMHQSGNNCHRLPLTTVCVEPHSSFFPFAVVLCHCSEPEKSSRNNSLVYVAVLFKSPVEHVAFSTCHHISKSRAKQLVPVITIAPLQLETRRQIHLVVEDWRKRKNFIL